MNEDDQYNEELILDACEEIRSLRNKNNLENPQDVLTLAEKLTTLLKSDDFLDREKIKKNLQENLDYFQLLSKNLIDREVLGNLHSENVVVLEFLVSEVLDENYTLCHRLISVN